MVSSGPHSRARQEDLKKCHQVALNKATLSSGAILIFWEYVVFCIDDLQGPGDSHSSLMNNRLLLEYILCVSIQVLAEFWKQ